MARKMNPREELVDELSEWYIDMVFTMADDLSPVRPWYEVDLTPDEQVERWRVTRPNVFPWLAAVAPYLGTTGDALLADKASLSRVFYETLENLVPLAILDDPAGDTLKLMVQSMGPEDVAAQLPKVERMYQRRIAESQAYLAATQSPAVAGPVSLA